ncbi:DeoR/GlpR family DNA-binding transcription regulator [Agromyces atrinae]|uniref:DeoR/GlpR family transcriptional regulator of sugar metabolism n=1 Tax=Agromyces atrinae TaxID=592376 RepID=A0A4Q2MDU2_9MICO|nr:DeoR/GlpR family DNA-binding transcription regulator [Agromyces atrinae]NYD67544.1 DeoR/GlpR family transcriptional regulator of sugar metabolism [Agromyces atrinae]RXZ88242.1 DeoR/GlpR transcriptional regulator [Agromyces atrinae]
MAALLASERRARLLEILEQHGSVRLESAADALAVSAMTVRRDLEGLEAEGLLRRVRGGAVSVIAPRTFGERVQTRSPAKTVIARKALALVPRSGAVAFDASSTSGMLISLIDDADGLVIATNSFDNAAAARRSSGIRSIFVGGELDESSGSYVGPVAGRAARSLGYERFFTSASAVDPATGTSEVSLDEAQVKLDFAAVADETVLLIDSSKLGRRALAHALDWSTIDVMITDLDPADERLAPFRPLTDLL